jgi:hypothetical protein
LSRDRGGRCKGDGAGGNSRNHRAGVGQPRTHVGTFDDYFQALIGWERLRASQFGIIHYCTIAVNPKEANNCSLLMTISRSSCGRTPIAFFGQTERIDVDELADPAQYDQHSDPAPRRPLSSSSRHLALP